MQDDNREIQENLSDIDHQSSSVSGVSQSQSGHNPSQSDADNSEPSVADLLAQAQNAFSNVSEERKLEPIQNNAPTE